MELSETYNGFNSWPNSYKNKFWDTLFFSFGCYFFLSNIPLPSYRCLKHFQCCNLNSSFSRHWRVSLFPGCLSSSIYISFKNQRRLECWLTIIFFLSKISILKGDHIFDCICGICRNGTWSALTCPVVFRKFSLLGLGWLFEKRFEWAVSSCSEM